VTGLHIHALTAAGTDGPVVFDLVPGQAPKGTASPLAGEFPVDHVQQDLLREGRMYADIHTRVYPDGEIRGAIAPSPDEGPHGPAGPEDASYDFVATAAVAPGLGGAKLSDGRLR
jgi:hypothetical protein